MDINKIKFNIDIFEEVNVKEAFLKSRSNLRAPPPEENNRLEKEFHALDDSTLFQIIARHDLDNLRVLAFAISIMQKRFHNNFVVHGGNINIFL